jgi:hypothetical protein
VVQRPYQISSKSVQLSGSRVITCEQTDRHDQPYVRSFRAHRTRMHNNAHYSAHQCNYESPSNDPSWTTLAHSLSLQGVFKISSYHSNSMSPSIITGNVDSIKCTRFLSIRLIICTQYPNLFYLNFLAEIGMFFSLCGPNLFPPLNKLTNVQ